MLLQAYIYYIYILYIQYQFCVLRQSLPHAAKFSHVPKRSKTIGSSWQTCLASTAASELDAELPPQCPNVVSHFDKHMLCKCCFCFFFQHEYHYSTLWHIHSAKTVAGAQRTHKNSISSTNARVCAGASGTASASAGWCLKTWTTSRNLTERIPRRRLWTLGSPAAD